MLNNSSNATHFVWHYPDGQKDSTNIDGQFIFTETGQFEVMLEARNEFCSDTFTLTVNVIDDEGISSLDPDKVTGIEQVDDEEKMNITTGPQSVTIKSQLVLDQEVIFQIYNNAGQLVFEESRERLDSAPVELDIHQLAQGVFHLKVISHEEVLRTEKFIKN